MKKMTSVLIALAAALLTVGFSCVNDPFVVPVDLTLSQTHDVNNGNAGSNPSFGGTTYVTLNNQIDESYRDNITSTRISDLRISTIGDFSGQFSVNVLVNDARILYVSGGSWNDFHTPQSVLTSSLISRDPAGYGALQLALWNLQNRQDVSVKLEANGTITTPYPEKLQVKIELISQVDAEVGGD